MTTWRRAARAQGAPEGALAPPDPLKIAVAPANPNWVDFEMAVHGGTIIEISKHGEGSTPMLDGVSNRRIIALTPMQISGPAAGHARLPTAADP